MQTLHPCCRSSCLKKLHMSDVDSDFSGRVRPVLNFRWFLSIVVSIIRYCQSRQASSFVTMIAVSFFRAEAETSGLGICR